MLGNEKGLALIWAYLVAVFLLTLLTGFYSLTTWDSKHLAIDTQKTQAFYLAEAAIDRKLNEVRQGNTNALQVNDFFSLGSYHADYSVVPSALDDTYYMITATGTAGGQTEKVLVSMRKILRSLPPGVKGASTIRSKATIAGKLTIDGRLWSADGLTCLTCLANGKPGVAGIANKWSLGTPTINSTAATKIGGYSIAPATNPSPLVFNTTATTDMDNDTLRHVLGLADANPIDLNSYKTTIDNSEGPLALTLDAADSDHIYYFEPSDSEAINITLNNQSGILIVSKSDFNAKAVVSGNFTGLIIADKLTLGLNTKVVGAAVIMKNITNGASSASVLGGSTNANLTSILYSEEALLALPEIPNAAYMQSRFKICGWEHPAPTSTGTLVPFVNQMGTTGTTQQNPD